MKLKIFIKHLILVPSMRKLRLNGLSLKLNEGDFVTVIGGNGAGKSTLLNAVAGVWPVDEGQIVIDGTRCNKAFRA